MRKAMAFLAVVLALGLAQRLEVSGGSPFGVQGGVRLALVPFLVDARVYGGVGLEALGAGADLLLRVPLTDLYLGLGAFYGTGPALSLPQDARGQGGVRGVLGTWLNLPLPLLGAYLEVYPTYYLRPTPSLGMGAALGVSLGL
nr:hypothetical protein [Thermus igniterrae]